MRKFLLILWICLSVCGALATATIPAYAAQERGIGTQFAGQLPVARLFVIPLTGQAPLEVRADASASTGGGIWPIEVYSLNFGDGPEWVNVPGSAPIASHTYRSSGNFTITLFVMDSVGFFSNATALVAVHLPPGDFPPEAALSVSPSTGEVPLTVTADASASADGDATPIQSYLFDFGDGSPRVGPSGSPTAQHIYRGAGTYQVTVFVTDTVGLQSKASASVTLTMPELPPAAVLRVAPSSGAPPLEVVADASSSADWDATPIATYLFDFGDGSPAIGPSASSTAQHLYAVEGEYSVTVTVTDTAGLSASATAQVTVARTLDFPPSGVLSVTPSSGPAPLTVFADASASTDTDATPISFYEFDFGDGSLPIGPMAISSAYHTYHALGTYTVTLTVTDTAGLQSTTSGQVRVVPPPDQPPAAVLTIRPPIGQAPLTVTADASGSTDTDSTPIATYLFDFGDGSTAIGPSPSPTASHIYQVGGTYTITLTVTDTAGMKTTASAQLLVYPYVPQVERPPVPALSIRPSSGAPPLVVVADASGSTDTDDTPIATYLFNFGDGSPAVGPSPTPLAYHTYQAVGTYTITVTVTDTAGLFATTSGQVRVSPQVDQPPVPVLVILPFSGMAPLTVTADASGSTDTDATPIANYVFNFGDGSPTFGPSPSPFAQHTYFVPGAYTVTVVVTDTAGLQSSTSRPVQVSQPSLIGNPGFEGGTFGWKAGSTDTLLERVVGGYSGAWAARLSNTGTSPATCALNDSPNWVVLTSQGSYQGSLWVRADTPDARLKLRFREYVAGENIATQLSSVPLLTSWQQVTLNYVPAAPGISTLDFNALISDAPPGVCFYADDASIQFFPGASGGNNPPSAALAVTPASGTAPLGVVADASGSVDPDTHSIATYLFFFGDGTDPVGPQAGASVAHLFAGPGSYTVTVYVVDTLGLASAASALVEVSVPSVDEPPRAALTVTPGAGSAPLTVTADASSSIDPDSSPIATYLFDFGDGTPLVGPQAAATAQHTYAAAGVYTVRVTVRDTAGLAADATAAVTVSGLGELAGNPGFEAGASGWKGTDKVVLERVAGGRSGEWAARLSNTATQNVSCGLNDSPNWVTRTAPGSYVASLWVRADVPGATLKLLLREYNGGALVGSRTSTVVLSTSWQQVVASYVPAAPGLSTLDFSAYISSSPPGTCFYADDVSITLR